MNVELFIHSNDLMIPVVYEGIELSSQRAGEPAQLNFTVIKDRVDMGFNEGNPVRFTVNGVNLFYGFIFTKSRDKNHHIKVTCYDQIRYLKNKDTYLYKNKSASELIKMIANDFNLQIGDIDNTKYKIPHRLEENQTLLDIIYNALDVTYLHTGKTFVLFDNFGKLTLKDIEDMKLNAIIDNETASNFNYETSIDRDTYNKVKLRIKDKKGNGVYLYKDSENINKWGVLQYFEEIDKDENPHQIGKQIIDKINGKNRKTRTLSIQGMMGDLRVRGGVSLPVFLDLGDIQTRNFLIVDSVTHIFKENNHTMDLQLIGGSRFV